MAKKGDIVTIYEKPLTHEKEEGKAKLHKLIMLEAVDENGDSGFWEVEFLKEPGETFQRWVYPS